MHISNSLSFATLIDFNGAHYSRWCPLHFEDCKPAKEPCVIAGISQKKEAVFKWNLIRHDKLLTHQIQILIVDDEYNLHHKFSLFANKADKIAVDTLFKCFKGNNNPYFSNDRIINFITGKFIDPELTENLIHSIKIGDGVYSEFKSS